MAGVPNGVPSVVLHYRGEITVWSSHIWCPTVWLRGSLYGPLLYGEGTFFVWFPTVWNPTVKWGYLNGPTREGINV